MGLLDSNRSPIGYGRFITNENQIQEGTFDRKMTLNGQSRIIFENGEYYEGNM